MLLTAVSLWGCSHGEKPLPPSEKPAEVQEEMTATYVKALKFTADSLFYEVESNEVENGGQVYRSALNGSQGAAQVLGSLKNGDAYVICTRADGKELVTILNETELNRFIPKSDYIPLGGFRIVLYAEDGSEDTLTITSISETCVKATGKNGESIWDKPL